MDDRSRQGRKSIDHSAEVSAGSYESSRSCPDFIAAKRAAELHFAETKTVAEVVRGPSEFFQFRAALGVQQIELFTAVREAAETDSEQPDFSFYIPMGAKEFLKHRKNIGIEPRGLPSVLGARMRFESASGPRHANAHAGRFRYAGFETHTRSKTLGEPTRLDSDIFAVFSRTLSRPSGCKKKNPAARSQSRRPHARR